MLDEFLNALQRNLERDLGPLSLSGTSVLRNLPNLPNLRDPQSLPGFETDRTLLRAIELRVDPPSGPFEFAYQLGKFEGWCWTDNRSG